ncbi:Plasmid segregation protein ParM [Paraburkholderia domus]|uniref:ParM/StbA family protein n=1 Tax=Paraburkholderia domus TaxID=2793075 RepID=UPI0019135266|nr:ParM/StbA family protein [Paraburkholderia domus]MBK5051786.1 ParM/StbA family protein [Burkholderia sp. R-70006]CAE6793892.1 Plasmid segregation protein ParM [Paraburkholderia domus]
MAKSTAATEQGADNVVALSVAGQMRYVGVDDGHSGIKVVTDGGQKFYVPSRIVRGADLITIGGADDHVYESEDGTLYAVSESLPFMDTTFSDYALSDINRVLVHHALLQAGQGGQDVSIVTGLPVGDYYVANQPNREFISRKVENLLGATVRHKNESIELARIVKHNVVSEGIAAFFDLLLDMNGRQRDDIAAMIENGAIGIVDIGGKTTDIAVVINGGSTVDGKRSGTDNVGCLSLSRAVENELKAKFNATAIAPAQVDRAVREGVVRIFGSERECADIVAEQKQELAQQIIKATHRKMRDASDLERVFFVGGGVELLEEQLAGLYPHGEFVEDPQFANARGMYKAAKYLQQS